MAAPAIQFQPDLEIKRLWGKIEPEFKELTLEGDVKVGVIDVYIATWQVDEGRDQFLKGAFKAAIAEHRLRGNRQVRMKSDHDILIGGFPIDTVVEDKRGLRATGHLNLDNELGRKLWSLIKQKVLVDMSVGYTAVDWEIKDGIRVIKVARLWEGSVVDEPMNRGANILSFKSLREMKVCPYLDEGWDAKAAAEHIFESDLDPSLGLIDGQNVCDVVEGKLVIIPEALLEVKTKDPKAICEIERHLAAAGVESPYPDEVRQYWSADNVKSLTTRQLEAVLVESGHFSQKAAKIILTSLPGRETVEPKPEGSSEFKKQMRLMIEEMRQARHSVNG